MEQKTIKALIVEDVFLIERLIEHIIGPYAVCKSVQNGKDAVSLFTKEYFNGEPFNLVCLDIYLPEMDGIEVLQGIRSFEDEIRIKEDERTRILMVTSLANQNIIKKARKIGCDGYITKPFSKDQIIDELVRLKLIKEKTAN